MGLDPPIDITATQRKIILELLQRYLPDTVVWAYGSRVKWSSRPASDLDLVAFAKPEQSGQVGLLKDSFEESELPFCVDLFVWSEIPDFFREQIQAGHVVLVNYKKKTVPKGWRQTRLGKIVRLVSGSTPSKQQLSYWNGSIPWVSAKDMKRFRLDDTEDHITFQASSDGAKMADAGTVLMLVRGMTLLNDLPLCVIQRPMTFNQDIKALVPNPEVTPEFLPYLLLGNKKRFLSLVDLAGHGTGRLNSEQVLALDILLPPLEEQRDIGRILFALDDKIELNRRVNETLEAMARALFKDWFVDFGPVRSKLEGRSTGLPRHVWDLFPSKLVDSELGKIPEGWKASTAAELSKLNSETWTRATLPSKINYVNLSNTKRGRIEFVKPYRALKAPSRAKRILRVGDTIVGTVRPGNGSYAIVSETDLTGSTGFAVLRPNSTEYAEFIYLAVTAVSNIGTLAHIADGAAYPAVRPEVVSATPLVIPDCRVLAQFSSIASALFRRIAHSERESRTISSIRDTLLPKLISGEIRVREAEKLIESVA